ncbi:hypothetical protein GGG16DRAFT_117814 [Schizophyllum commune]
MGIKPWLKPEPSQAVSSGLPQLPKPAKAEPKPSRASQKQHYLYVVQRLSKLPTLSQTYLYIGLPIYPASTLEREVDAEIDRLLEQKRASQNQIAVHEALVAPWRRLPTELWSESFLLAVPDDWDTALAGTRVLSYAAVCVAWRDVALATPQLWSTLNFDLLENPFRNHVSAVEAELKKAGDTSLRLCIHMDVCGDSGWDDAAWASISARSSRWESASLWNVPVPTLTSLSGRFFSTLRMLYICLDPGFADFKVVQIPLSVFASAPALDTFNLVYGTFIHRVQLPSSWSLSTLIINQSSTLNSLAPCVATIMACSATLQTCDISSIGPLNPSSAIQAPRAFPHLKKLTLDFNALTLSRYIACPNIESFSLCASLDTHLNPWDGLQIMLSNSANCAHLKSLSLKMLKPADSEALVGCLRRMSSVAELTLATDNTFGASSGNALTYNLLSAFIRYPSVPYTMDFMPHLARLDMTCGNGLQGLDYQDLAYALRRVIATRTDPALMEGVTDLVMLEYLSTNAPGYLPSLADEFDDQADPVG